MKKFSLLVLAGVMAFAFGCAHNVKNANKLEVEEDIPEWFLNGCAEFSGDKGGLICGTGASDWDDDISMCMEIATNRGFGDLAKAYETIVVKREKDYRDKIRKGEAVQGSEAVINASVTLTKTKLHGVKRIKGHISKKGRCYALVALDFQAWKDSLSKLGDGAAEEVLEKANTEWNELVTIANEVK